MTDLDDAATDPAERNRVGQAIVARHLGGAAGRGGLGRLASSAVRFARAWGRPVHVRRQLARPVARPITRPLHVATTPTTTARVTLPPLDPQPPRWWGGPVADDDALPDRGLRRVVRRIPDPSSPGAATARLAPQTVAMRMPPEVDAVGRMTSPADSRPRQVSRPPAPPPAGGPPGNAGGAGARTAQDSGASRAPSQGPTSPPDPATPGPPSAAPSAAPFTSRLLRRRAAARLDRAERGRPAVAAPHLTAPGAATRPAAGSAAAPGPTTTSGPAARGPAVPGPAVPGPAIPGPASGPTAVSRPAADSVPTALPGPATATSGEERALTSPAASSGAAPAGTVTGPEVVRRSHAVAADPSSTTNDAAAGLPSGEGPALAESLGAARPGHPGRTLRPLAGPVRRTTTSRAAQLALAPHRGPVPHRSSIAYGAPLAARPAIREVAGATVPTSVPAPPTGAPVAALDDATSRPEPAALAATSATSGGPDVVGQPAAPATRATSSAAHSAVPRHSSPGATADDAPATPHGAPVPAVRRSSVAAARAGEPQTGDVTVPGSERAAEPRTAVVGPAGDEVHAPPPATTSRPPAARLPGTGHRRATVRRNRHPLGSDAPGLRRLTAAPPPVISRQRAAVPAAHVGVTSPHVVAAVPGAAPEHPRLATGPEGVPLGSRATGTVRRAPLAPGSGRGARPSTGPGAPWGGPGAPALTESARPNTVGAAARALAPVAVRAAGPPSSPATATVPTGPVVRRSPRATGPLDRDSAAPPDGAGDLQPGTAGALGGAVPPPTPTVARLGTAHPVRGAVAPPRPEAATGHRAHPTTGLPAVRTFSAAPPLAAVGPGPGAPSTPRPHRGGSGAPALAGSGGMAPVRRSFAAPSAPPTPFAAPPWASGPGSASGTSTPHEGADVRPHLRPDPLAPATSPDLLASDVEQRVVARLEEWIASDLDERVIELVERRIDEETERRSWRLGTEVF